MAVSYLHLPMPVAISRRAAGRDVKGSLVACYFMHLISERKLIYGCWLITVVFFVVLLALPVAHRTATALDSRMNLKVRSTRS